MSDDFRRKKKKLTQKIMIGEEIGISSLGTVVDPKSPFANEIITKSGSRKKELEIPGDGVLSYWNLSNERYHMALMSPEYAWEKIGKGMIEAIEFDDANGIGLATKLDFKLAKGFSKGKGENNQICMIDYLFRLVGYWKKIAHQLYNENKMISG